MGLSNTEGADNEKALAAGINRVSINKLARSPQCPTLGRICPSKGRLIAVKRASPVTLGNTCRVQAVFFALHPLALTASGDPLSGFVDYANQTDAIADWTLAHSSPSVAHWGLNCAGGGSVP